MNDNGSTVRNRYIDLLRFLFCMIIFLHHSGHVTRGEITILPSGGLAADAFFMLTGYYAIRHISHMSSPVKNPMGYSIRYTLKKLLKTMPYMAFGTVIVYILELVIIGLTGGSIDLADMSGRLRCMLSELTLLPLTGIMGPLDPLTYRNAPMWYLSALLLALPIVMYIGIRCKDIFRNYIIWFIPPMLQGWMVARFGGVLPWQDFVGPVSSAAIRGFSSLLMGAGIYYASKAIADNKTLSSRPMVATVLELLALVIFLCNVVRGVHGYEELISLYVIALSLALALSGITYTSRITWKPLEFLGTLSLPIYCLHWGIYRWVAAAFGQLNYYIGIVITFVLCIITALLIMYAVRLITAKRIKVS